MTSFGQNPEVLVVGAGPVGLLSALNLARQGVRVSVIEREEYKAAHSYALALHPGSLRLLDEFGLTDGLLAKSHKISRIALHGEKDASAEIDLSDLPGDHPYVAVVRQNLLEQALADALKKARVNIHWLHSLAFIDGHPDTVSVTVNKLVMDVLGYGVPTEEWHVGRTFEFDAPFVIGADGIRSVVRRQLGLDFPSTKECQHFAVFEFETDADLGNTSHLLLKGGTTDVLWPMTDGYCRWSFEVPDFEADDAERRKEHLDLELVYGGQSEDEARNRLRTFIKTRAPWFTGSLGRLRWHSMVRFERRLVPSFGDQRIWLAGDAAHVTGPAGVQSMNVGLREAVELSGTINTVLRQGGLARAFEEYNQNRLTEWKTLLAADGGLETSDQTEGWIRKVADDLLPCLPASGSDLASLAGQLHLTLADGVRRVA